jgi:hypothetical protein
MKMEKYVDYKQICVVDIIKYGLICNKQMKFCLLLKIHLFVVVHIDTYNYCYHHTYNT